MVRVTEISTLDEGEAILQYPEGLNPASVADLEEWLSLVLRKLKRRSMLSRAAHF